MNISGDDLQKGVLGLLGVIITGLFTWRGVSKVKTDNARESRESRFEENQHKQFAALQDEVKRLKEQNAEIPVLSRRLHDRDRTIRNLLDSLDSEQQRNARRWAPESAFAPLDEKPPKKD